MEILLLAFLYTLFNELEDECVRGTFFIKKDFFNTIKSWKFKWKLDANGNLIPYKNKWYHFKFFKPRYEERFPYSSTLLVFLTDGEHLFQFLKIATIALIPSIITSEIIDSFLFLSGHILFGIIKETILKKFLK